MKNVTPLFINLHWLPIAARIKFKALMFAYKTTTGSAPLYLNSLFQTYVPLEASILQMNVALLFIPKRHKSLSQTFTLNFPSWWNDLPNSIPAAESLDIFKKRIKTSLPSLFDPLTLALSILILFFKKKQKKLVPFFDLHSIHLLLVFLKTKQLTLAFLIFLYSIRFLFIYYIIKKNPCYVYCV